MFRLVYFERLLKMIAPVDWIDAGFLHLVKVNVFLRNISVLFDAFSPQINQYREESFNSFLIFVRKIIVSFLIFIRKISIERNERKNVLRAQPDRETFLSSWLGVGRRRWAAILRGWRRRSQKSYAVSSRTRQARQPKFLSFFFLFIFFYSWHFLPTPGVGATGIPRPDLPPLLLLFLLLHPLLLWLFFFFFVFCCSGVVQRIQL